MHRIVLQCSPITPLHTHLVALCVRFSKRNRPSAGGPLRECKRASMLGAPPRVVVICVWERLTACSSLRVAIARATLLAVPHRFFWGDYLVDTTNRYCISA